MNRIGWLLGLGLGLLLMTQRSRARELIMDFEGVSLQRYVDASGLAHIGYGHLIQPGEQYNVITQAKAEALLDVDISKAQGCIAGAVSVAITTTQRDALTSFVYNIGCAAFRGSTLLKRLNAGDFEDAADELLRWNKAGGEVLQSLVDRRFLEREMFLT